MLEASTVASALVHLEGRTEVTLLVIDVAMPGPVNGLELAHEVRRRWRHIAIIVVSARITPTPEQTLEGALFLEKPYFTNRLARMIREMELCRPAG